MKKLILILCIVVLQLLTSLKCEPGLSKIKIGNEFFDQVFKLMTQKIIVEVNKNKNNIPDFNMDLKLAKLIPLKFGAKNLTFDDIQYHENQVQIKHTTGEEISFKLSKLNFLNFIIINHIFR